MNSNPSQRNTKKKSRDEQTIHRFIEELSWVLASYENLDFKALPELVQVARHRVNVGDEARKGMVGYVSPNPNTHFLVGVLPRMLNDDSVFASNEDIAAFSRDVLDVTVPRWEKKSKYEIIGHIVCNIYGLDDRALENLVRALSKLVSGDKKAEQIFRKEKAQRTSWNEVIRLLSNVDK